uniref:Uncharacterized protein n=1 Tax=Ananas comosus var. bracteatus TaxID=296719 RepID=A0A6V7NTH3_ANACO|nr:unnamed protein product [Ananas comosus var. bracteatus]
MVRKEGEENVQSPPSLLFFFSFSFSFSFSFFLLLLLLLLLLPSPSSSLSRVVVDSVPTYGSYLENCGIYCSAKVAEVEDLRCSQVASAELCTGTTLKLYRNKWLYRYSIGSVPVHLAIFSEPEPRFPELETRGGEGREAI